MSWNGNDKAASQKVPSNQAAKQSNTAFRGILAGGLVVVLASAALYFLMRTPTPKNEIKEVQRGNSSRIVEAKPAPAPHALTNAVSAIDPKKLPDPMYKQPTNPKLPKKKYIPTVEEVEKARLGPDGKPRKMAIYKTPVEQALAAIFSTKMGNPPPMLPDIPRFTSEEQLNKFLNTKFEYDKDAPRAVNEDRIMMQQVQEEFRNYKKDGGDIKGFVDYYVGELRASYEQWKTAQKMVVSMAREGESPETLRTVRDKANALLEAKGIKKLSFPPSIRKAMGEE